MKCRHCFDFFLVPPLGTVALLAMDIFTRPGKYLDRSVSCRGQVQQVGCKQAGLRSRLVPQWSAAKALHDRFMLGTCLASDFHKYYE